MTEQQIREWSERLPVELELMIMSPELLLGAMRLVAMARAINPDLPKGPLAALALTVLAWELMAKAAGERRAA
jgi:hypothetical protein